MEDYSDTEAPSREGSAQFEDQRSKNIAVLLPESTLAKPKSIYRGFDENDNPIPPLPVWNEAAAVTRLVKELQEDAEALKESTENGFMQFELNDFTIYLNSVYYPDTMRSLQHLSTKTGNDRFYFDGVLSFGETCLRLQRVQFMQLPIGDYGEEEHTVEDIWIESAMNVRTKSGICYRLGKPAAEYARFHQPFLWLADFAKHVVDYTTHMARKERHVPFACFKQDFSRWLLKTHRKSRQFAKWYRRHGDPDFRRSLVANVEFIWKEICGVLGNEMRAVQKFLVVFQEIHSFTRYKLFAPLSTDSFPPTVVTPYIMECFGHMQVGKILRVAGQPASIGPPRADPELRQAPTKPRLLDHHARQAMIQGIKTGDTVSLTRDGEETDTKWKKLVGKGSINDSRWFGLVQKIHENPQTGCRSFDVTWLYRPVDTPCCEMKYPWSNELFLSDHCTCDTENPEKPLKEDDILDTVDINWFGNPTGLDGEFFVRQTYLVQGRKWVTLQRSHLRCNHELPRIPYRAGDTVLACASAATGILEPFEVVEVFKQREKGPFVRLRKLLRRKQVDSQAGHARPNELVYTDDLIVETPDKIAGNCYVRFFYSGENIPAPYSYDGTGNLFFITHKKEEDVDGRQRFLPFAPGSPFPASLRQGFDPRRQDGLPKPKLKGLDLFCGGGNFGRGLEDGGAVDMCWANDIRKEAVHTYMVNSDKTHPFLGSVDDLLEQALLGKFSDNVPRPEDVDFISAGSPCPGFSTLTQVKATPKLLKDCSLVASFASFVHFYRPKYGILENVKAIVPGKHSSGENMFSQLICAIIGMGYQTQIIMGDPYCYGGPQSRIRVFLYFAAPGCRLPDAPFPSHSLPPGASVRTLGKMSNGEQFIKQANMPSAFRFVSAGEATSDLPSIYDGRIDICIPCPDHRLSVGFTDRLLKQIAVIPTHPFGMNFVKAWQGGQGVMSLAERSLFPERINERSEVRRRMTKISRAWGRVRPNHVFGAITTRCSPSDAHIGTQNHWSEPRPLSIMEARRAQGFPDQDVILGDRIEQWKVIGNSVARQVAVALGLQFREAWFGSLFDDAVPSREAEGTPELYYSANATPLEQEEVSTPTSSRAQSEASGRGRKRTFRPSSAVELLSAKKIRLQRVGAPVNEDGADDPTDERQDEPPYAPLVSRAIIPGKLSRPTSVASYSAPQGPTVVHLPQLEDLER